MSKATILLISGDEMELEGFTAWEADHIKIKFEIPTEDGQVEKIGYPLQNVLEYSVIE